MFYFLPILASVLFVGVSSQPTNATSLGTADSDLEYYDDNYNDGYDIGLQDGEVEAEASHALGYVNHTIAIIIGVFFGFIVLAAICSGICLFFRQQKQRTRHRQQFLYRPYFLEDI
jgi:hypothetical protein